MSAWWRTAIAGGMIAALERDFIQNLLDFGELRVSQIMVPRPDMFTLPVELPFPEMIQAIKRSRFSRVPIYEETHDQVLGVLHAKDILELCHQAPLRGRDAPASPAPGLLCPGKQAGL